MTTWGGEHWFKLLRLDTRCGYNGDKWQYCFRENEISWRIYKINLVQKPNAQTRMHIFAPMYSHAYTHILYVKKTVKNRTARREGIRKHKILYLCTLPDRSLLWIFTFTYLLYTHAHRYSHKFFHTFTCADKHINIYTHTSMNVSLNIPGHIYFLDMYIEERREKGRGKKREIG